MRRPGPLPPPGAEETRRVDVPASGAGPDPDATETAPVEPLWHVRDLAPGAAVPAEDPAQTPDAGDVAPEPAQTGPVGDIVPLRPDVAAEEEPRSDAEDAPDDASPVGVRDVWSAARARRRALRAEMRRFTARRRRRRIAWLSALGVVVLLVLGTVGVAYSPLFAVERVRVTGTSALRAADVEAALASQVGRPLPLVDEGEIKAALVGFPLVESYTLEARPPHELVVRLVERTPVGAFEGPAGFTVVDAAGVALSTSPEPPAGIPLLDVTGGPDSSAFAAVGRVYRSLPDEIRTAVTEMTATTANDVTLIMGEWGTSVVWGGAADSAKKAVVLQAAMVQSPPSEVVVYDVSSPGTVVLR